MTATIPVPLGPPQYLAFSPDGRTVYVSIWDEARTVAAIGVLDTTDERGRGDRPHAQPAVPGRGHPGRPAALRAQPRLRHHLGRRHRDERGDRRDQGGARTRTGWSSPRTAGGPTRPTTSRTWSRSSTPRPTPWWRRCPSRRSPHSVAVHPTRPLVAGADYDSDSVTMIDTDSERVVATVPVGDGPQDVTWAPDGRFAYVAERRRGHGLGDRRRDHDRHRDRPHRRRADLGRGAAGRPGGLRDQPARRHADGAEPRRQLQTPQGRHPDRVPPLRSGRAAELDSEVHAAHAAGRVAGRSRRASPACRR